MFCQAVTQELGQGPLKSLEYRLETYLEIVINIKLIRKNYQKRIFLSVSHLFLSSLLQNFYLFFISYSLFYFILFFSLIIQLITIHTVIIFSFLIFFRYSWLLICASLYYDLFSFSLLFPSITTYCYYYCYLLLLLLMYFRFISFERILGAMTVIYHSSRRSQ